MRLKKFFTEAPEGNMWRRIAIYMFLFRYLGVTAVIFMIPLITGLLAPGQDINYVDFTESLAVTLAEAFNKIYTIGSNIATTSPIASKVLAFLISNVIWLYWAGGVVLLIDILRTCLTRITKWRNKR